MTHQGIANAATILPVIRHLYDAAIDGNKWPVFLKELAAAFRAKGSQIVRVQPRESMLNFSALYGYDEDVREMYGAADTKTAIARFERHFAELMPTDPRMRLLERFPGRPLSCRLEISEAELHASKIYQDMLRLADVEYSLVVSLGEDDGSLIILGVFRSKESRYFNEDDVATFGEIIPHLKQAIQLSEHLTQANFASRAALDTLDSIAMGILIVDDGARLIHANAAGQRIIGLGDGLTTHGGMLRLHDHNQDAALRRIVRSALAEARTGAIPLAQVLPVMRPSGREPLPLLAGTLWHGASRQIGGLDRPLAVLFVSLPEEPIEAPAELLRRVFGLTLAEARVCERLVQGQGLPTIAQDLEIAVETVRVHLKNIFAKTGVSRQAELVAKIMATPVWAHYQTRMLRLGKTN
jgi:DNA-binding CsgD family transcriptional regulator